MVASGQQHAERERAVVHARPPLWRDVRVLRVVIQVAFVVALALLLWWLYGNLVTNLRGSGLRTDFGFLDQNAGFTLLGSDFSARQPIWQAILVGTYNTVRVSLLGIALATILGVVIGVARLSHNWLVSKVAATYVEALRNIPLLVLLLILYLGVLQALPQITEAYELAGLMVLSNRGLHVPWIQLADASGVFLLVCALGLVLAGAVGWWRTRRFDATGQPHHRVLYGLAVFLAVAALAWLALDRPVSLTTPDRVNRIVDGGYDMTLEYGALLVGLVIYTAAFIAEIVRGSIQAVPRGQSEAAEAVGLGPFQRLRFVILPQALRIAVPPTGNEFLNLAKNSSLGVFIAFPEAVRVVRIAISQGQPAPQLVAILMGLFLVVSLSLSLVTNLVNRRLEVGGR